MHCVKEKLNVQVYTLSEEKTWQLKVLVRINYCYATELK